MKKLLIALVLLVVAAVVVVTRSENKPLAPTTPVTHVNDHSTAPAHAGHGMGDYAATGRIPAHYETAPDISSLPPTLSPEIFTGNKKLAYQVAKEIPQILAQLPCYCHCDRGHGHKSLHSCFESEHGENCGICIGEALMAQSLKRQGLAAGEIRERVIAAYGGEKH
jgi:hypothetical protein